MKVLPGRSSDSEGPGRFGKCLPKGRASRRPPRRASPRPRDAPTEWSGRRLHGRSPSLRLVGTLAHRVAVQAPHPRPRTGTTGVPGGPPRGGDRSQSASLDTLVGLCVCVHAPRCAYTRARGPSPRRCTAATANGGAARRGPRPGAAPCRPSAYSAAAFPPVSVRLPPAFEPRPASGPDAYAYAYACVGRPMRGAASGRVVPLHTAGGVSRVDVWGGGSGFSEGKGKAAPWAGIRSGTAESRNRTLELVSRKGPKSRPAAKSPARPKQNPPARPGWPPARPPRGPCAAPARPGGPGGPRGGRFRPHPATVRRFAAAVRARGGPGRAPGPGWGGTRRSSRGRAEMEGGRRPAGGLRG